VRFAVQKTDAEFTRREYIQGTLATLAGTVAGSAVPAAAAQEAPRRTVFQLCKLSGNPASRALRRGRQEKRYDSGRLFPDRIFGLPEKAH
jgi:hypothetical protein